MNTALMESSPRSMAFACSSLDNQDFWILIDAKSPCPKNFNQRLPSGSLDSACIAGSSANLVNANCAC